VKGEDDATGIPLLLAVLLLLALIIGFQAWRQPEPPPPSPDQTEWTP